MLRRPEPLKWNDMNELGASRGRSPHRDLHWCCPNTNDSPVTICAWTWFVRLLEISQRKALCLQKPLQSAAHGNQYNSLLFHCCNGEDHAMNIPQRVDEAELECLRPEGHINWAHVPSCTKGRPPEKADLKVTTYLVCFFLSIHIRYCNSCWPPKM